MTEVVISKVGELSPHDKVITGAVLGAVTAAETLTVKAVREADNDRCAVTFWRVGTLFLHRDQLVETLPARSRDDDES